MAMRNSSRDNSNDNLAGPPAVSVWLTTPSGIGARLATGARAARCTYATSSNQAHVHLLLVTDTHEPAAAPGQETHGIDTISIHGSCCARSLFRSVPAPGRATASTRCA